MATSTIRRLTYTFEHDGAAYPAWKTTRVDGLLGFGAQGRIVRVVTRMDAGGNATDGEVRIVNGDHLGAVAVPADIASVPDEDVALELTGLTLAGSATDAEDDENVELNARGAFYSIVGAQDASIILGFNFEAGAAGASTVHVTIYIAERAS